MQQSNIFGSFEKINSEDAGPAAAPEKNQAVSLTFDFVVEKKEVIKTANNKKLKVTQTSLFSF